MNTVRASTLAMTMPVDFSSAALSQTTHNPENVYSIRDESLPDTVRLDPTPAQLFLAYKPQDTWPQGLPSHMNEAKTRLIARLKDEHTYVHLTSIDR